MQGREKRKRKQIWRQSKQEYFLKLFTPRIAAILKKLPRNEQLIKSTYLFGLNGTGKTIKACDMLLNHIYTSYINKGATIAHYSFIRMDVLLSTLKTSFHKDSDVVTDDLLSTYKNVKYLIIDDLGTEKLTDWVYEILYTIINDRYENNLPTIITSNYSLEDLDDELRDNGRISSRIYEMCKVVEVVGKNKRLRK